MIALFEILLRLAGAGLIGLALLHVPIARRLRWREDVAKLSKVNAAVFHAHAFFICVVLVGMGLPALIEPALFTTPSRPALWGCGFLTIFWALRLAAQWVHYQPSWWQGKPFETSMHWFFTFVWFFLTVLFAACTATQMTLI